MYGMRVRGLHIGRRSVALLLAYLLALQVILTAWAVIAPVLAQGIVQTALCATHQDGAPSPGGSPANCPCGPMCTSGSCAGGGEPASAAALPVVFAIVSSVTLPPARAAAPARRIASEPERARAPPVLA
jgi:hypothetical protein